MKNAPNRTLALKGEGHVFEGVGMYKYLIVSIKEKNSIDDETGRSNTA
jgi:hypothetical protein